MLQAEVLSVLSGAATAVEQSIVLFSTIKNAVKAVKELPGIIEGHIKELNRLKDLVNLIGAEETLQRSAVAAAVEHVQGGAEKLSQRLELMKRHLEARRLDQVFWALSSGPQGHESMVGKIMRGLAEAKADIVTNILVVNVGLTQGANKSLYVDVATLKRVNGLIQKKLGDPTISLKLAAKVKGRIVNGEFHPDMACAFPLPCSCEH